MIVGQPHTATQAKLYDLRFWSILALLLGVVVRLVQYLSNRSLWGDEVNVALNIVNRSYLELLKPLDHNQAAPPGFLWIEKTAVQLFGNSEYALRLFPFVAGIIALLAFYKLANTYASKFAVPIAITLFACLKYTVYYTTEVKQYSSDVMIALLLCLLLLPLRHKLLNLKQLVGLSLLGAVFIWISHPTVFVMAGIEVGYFLTAANKQRLKLLVNRLPMYLTWLLSFASLYFLTVRGTLENDTLTSAWDARFPDSIFDVVWLLDTFGRFFYNPLGFLGFTDGVAIFAFIVGCVACYRRSRMTLLGITAPMIATLIASYLYQYPFRERLVLFLAPLGILIIAEGIAFLLTRPRQHKFFWILGILVGSILLIPPILQTGKLIVQPEKIEEIRPVIAYVKAQQQPDDRLYVYPSAENQFAYYAPKFGYAPTDYVIGVNSITAGKGKNRQISAKELKQFRREIRQFKDEARVWFLFSHLTQAEEESAAASVQLLGQQLDAFRQPGASVYLIAPKP